MKSQRFLLFFLVALCPIALYSQLPTLNNSIKNPTQYTLDFNKDYANPKRLNWADTSDFETATRGFIAGPKSSAILSLDKNRDTVWNFNDWNFLSNLNAASPLTVNPSLWRMEKLMSKAGLFEVKPDTIYQIRSFDLAVMSFVIGNGGYIIIDPLGNPATAKAGHDLFKESILNKWASNDPRKTLRAVIYTHSHIDHFGGIYGIIDPSQAKIPIYAPTGFLEEAVSENIYAGNVMGQRAAYMYGSLLPKNVQQGIGAGLGLALGAGSPTLKAPTFTLPSTDTTISNLEKSGLTIQFIYAPHTEAPSEMLFYFPDLKALCAAEDASHTLHNLYSLRGAKTRSAKDWVSTLTKVLDLWGDDVQVEFNSHHWPIWGNDTIKRHLETQRAMYKFINDQTLRLANMGYDMTTTAEIITNLPESLNKVWSSQGYYGSVNHNVKATWDLYLGWFDGKASHLHKLPDIYQEKGSPAPPTGASVKYVQYMGGKEKIIQTAMKDFTNGEYRWVAEVLQHVVNVDTTDKQAKYLLADALEQMGYQAVSGPWRDFYLTGALELRQGRQTSPKDASLLASLSGLTFLKSMTPDLLVDYISIMVDPYKADGKEMNFAFMITDGGVTDTIALQLKYSCLNYLVDSRATLDFWVTINKDVFDNIKSSTNPIQALVKLVKDKANLVVVNPPTTGETQLKAFASMLSPVDNIFNIITPNLPNPLPINPMKVKQN